MRKHNAYISLLILILAISISCCLITHTFVEPINQWNEDSIQSLFKLMKREDNEYNEFMASIKNNDNFDNDNKPIVKFSPKEMQHFKFYKDNLKYFDFTGKERQRIINTA